MKPSKRGGYREGAGRKLRKINAEDADLTPEEQAMVDALVGASRLEDETTRRALAESVATIRLIQRNLRAGARAGQLGADDAKHAAALARAEVLALDRLGLTTPPAPKPPSFGEDEGDADTTPEPQGFEDDLLAEIKG